MSSAITRNNTAEFVNTSGDTMTGPLLVPSGDATAAGIAFSGDADTGFYRIAANILGVTAGGGLRGAFYNGAFELPSAQSLIWTSDVGLKRASAGVLAVTNGSTGGGALNLLPIAAPAAPASGAVLYIDSADSDLKIKYADGTVVVIGNKP